ARHTMNMHLQFYTPATAGGVAAELLLDMELLQNYPNPFSDNTTIRFYLPQAGEATITISDLSGRAIRTINGDFPAGYSAIQLNGSGLAAGSIFYTLSHDGEEQTRTMVRVRQ
ncbi:MAG: T9SS type A sorting domain-containing protein, partial [Bacteroidota bacterium]